ncbi:MAG: hydroxymethylglutaryl-CoA reductase, degradative [Thermoplasmatota archaeon]
MARSPGPDFRHLTAAARWDRLAQFSHLAPQDRKAFRGGGAGADPGAFTENALGWFALPLGVAVGFVVDGQERAVPMAVEESSVVAAACHGAKLVRAGGGFSTIVDAPIMIGQVEVRGVRDVAAARRLVGRRQGAWRRALDATIPGMVARGGGVRKIHAREVGNRLVLHLLVDCRDAMGANLVNGLAEAFAPRLQKALDEAGLGGKIGLKILSNLAAHRRARASFRIPVAAVGGHAVAADIVAAQRFAEMDPFRAATHNKGIMNGIDAVAVATGNDWRALEAGAHAWAARAGTYRPLTRYAVRGGALEGRLEIPLPVGTVGGLTTRHPTALSSLRLMGNPDSRTLAAIMAAVGLAQNLAALKALSTQGIQGGHMRLHGEHVAATKGAKKAHSRAI